MGNQHFFGEKKTRDAEEVDLKLCFVFSYSHKYMVLSLGT